MRTGAHRPVELLDFKNAFIGPLIVAVSFAALASWTWLKGGDFFTDFGHQLYIAWRLSDGEMLYRDIPWLSGPFAHYVNAAVFSLSGVATSHLLIANLCVIAALAASVYWLSLRVSDRLSATFAVGFVLAISCFGHLLEEGVFNFLTPYSHDATYGTLICILLILSCDLWARRGKAIFAALAGLCAGLVVLTKIELLLAALFVVLVLFVCSRSLRLELPGKVYFIVGAALPLTASYLYFSSGMPQDDAFAAAFPALSLVFRSGTTVSTNPYQLGMLGFDNWRANLDQLAAVSCLALVLTGAALVLDRFVGKFKNPVPLSLTLAVALFATLYLKSSVFPWLEAPRFLTLLCPALMGLSLYVLRAKLSDQQKHTALTCILWLAFANILLLRLGLRARFYHYGFFLALPAAVSMILFYLYFIPVFLRSRGGGGETFRILAAGFFLTTVFVHLRFSEHYYSQRTVEVGSGADRLYLLSPEISPHTSVGMEAFDVLKKFEAPEDSFAVIPSGALLNYILRSRNPTGVPIVDLYVLKITGEKGLLARFQTSPPSTLLFVEVDDFLGRQETTGQPTKALPQFWNWVQQNYLPLAGPDALSGAVFPTIYRRKPAALPPS